MRLLQRCPHSLPTNMFVDASKLKKISSKLSVHLRGLMGEANLRFARGEVELAKKMCFEVIRQSPEAFEPYLTLAQMYENQNIKKYRGGTRIVL